MSRTGEANVRPSTKHTRWNMTKGQGSWISAPGLSRRNNVWSQIKQVGHHYPPSPPGEIQGLYPPRRLKICSCHFPQIGRVNKSNAGPTYHRQTPKTSEKCLTTTTQKQYKTHSNAPLEIRCIPMPTTPRSVRKRRKQRQRVDVGWLQLNEEYLHSAMTFIQCFSLTNWVTPTWRRS